MTATTSNVSNVKPKNVKFQGEDNDEEVLYIFRRTQITNVGWIFTTIILLLMPTVFESYVFNFNRIFPKGVTGNLILEITIMWYIFCFGIALERYLNWFFNVYIITNKRVIDMDFSGLLSRHISEAPLRNIEDVSFTITGTVETIFNFGSVRIQTAAELTEIEFEYVSDPGKIQDILSDMVANIKGVYVN